MVVGGSVVVVVGGSVVVVGGSVVVVGGSVVVVVVGGSVVVVVGGSVVVVGGSVVVVVVVVGGSVVVVGGSVVVVVVVVVVGGSVVVVVGGSVVVVVGGSVVVVVGGSVVVVVVWTMATRTACSSCRVFSAPSRSSSGVSISTRVEPSADRPVPPQAAASRDTANARIKSFFALKVMTSSIAWFAEFCNFCVLVIFSAAQGFLAPCLPAETGYELSGAQPGNWATLADVCAWLVMSLSLLAGRQAGQVRPFAIVLDG